MRRSIQRTRLSRLLMTIFRQMTLDGCGVVAFLFTPFQATILPDRWFGCLGSHISVRECEQYFPKSHFFTIWKVKSTAKVQLFFELCKYIMQFVRFFVSRFSLGRLPLMCRWKNGLKSVFSANCVKNAVNYVTAISQKSSNFAPQFKMMVMKKMIE